MQQASYYDQNSTQSHTGMNKYFSIMRFLGNFSKRLFDVIASFMGLFLLWPLFILIAVLIKRDSSGPVFFNGIRLGKNGRTFQMYKFRTMHETLDSYNGPRLTCKEDDRITPFGRWLRDTKVNELPQLWNVLKGDMSLVGPRPEDVIIGNDWEEYARKEILSVRPGITSPASILYHDEESLLTRANLLEDYFKDILPDKIRLDQLYVRNRSFGSDLDIIFWTLLIVVPRIVKEKVPEGYLFSGPFTRLINRYVSWFLIDALTSGLVIVIVSLLGRIQNPLNWGGQNLAILAIVLAFVFSGLNALLGLNKIEWSSATINDAIPLALSCWLVTFLFWLFNYLLTSFHWFGLEPLPSNMIFIMGFLAQVCFVATRFSWRIIAAIASIWLGWRRNALDIGERVLIVGAGDNFPMANWLLKQNEYQYVFRIIGVVDDNIPSKYGMFLNGCMVLGKVADLPAIVRKEKIGVIVFTTLKIPKSIKDYVDKLKANSSVRLVILDNLSHLITQQLITPAVTPRFSSWSDSYLKFMALHDNVTGLPNQVLFQDRLRHAIAVSKRTNAKPTVMFIELDFGPDKKNVDQKIWNELIRKATERLQKLRRESDSLVFLGEQGFAFIFDNTPDENAINKIADRIIESLSQPMHCDGQSYILCTTVFTCSNLENCQNLEVDNKEEALLDYLMDNRKIVRTSNGG
jgi:diguanylate cyclase (GGDEF)-like protein